jgi:hypothetical protein
MSKLSKLSRNRRTEAAKRKRSQQPLRTMANKTRKLRKHVNKYPEDKQSKALLNDKKV